MYFTSHDLKGEVQCGNIYTAYMLISFIENQMCYSQLDLEIFKF